MRVTARRKMPALLFQRLNLKPAWRVIGGQLIYNPTYSNFREDIQNLSEKKRIANSDDFAFSVWLDNKIKLVPEGGIAVTDLKDFDEVYVEVGGLDEKVINQFK